MGPRVDRLRTIQPRSEKVEAALKDAMRGAGIQFRQEIDRLDPHGQRDRHVDGARGFSVLVCIIEFERNRHPHQPGTNGS